MSTIRLGTQLVCMTGMLTLGIFLGSASIPPSAASVPSAGANEEEKAVAKGSLGPPVLINISSVDPKATAEFYSKMLGIEFARSLTEEVEAYHAPINKEGVQLQITGTIKGADRSKEKVTVYYRVDNIAEAIDAVKKAGGKAPSDTFDLKIPAKIFPKFKEATLRILGEEGLRAEDVKDTLGKAATVVGVDGSPIGLIELNKQAKLFYPVEPPTPLQLAMQKSAIELGKLLSK